MRVAVTSHRFHYPEELYRPLRDIVDVAGWPVDDWYDLDRLETHLDGIDLVHIHWPELNFGLTPQRQQAAIGLFRSRRIPIVLTMHDAYPHPYGRELGLASLRPWAEAASGVIHHSNWGRGEAEKLFAFDAAARHAVIYHAPWPRKLVSKDAGTRQQAEARFSLDPCTLRFGIHGGRRPGKDVQLALDAFAACSRADYQLFVLSLESENVPADPRISAPPYTFLSREDFKLAMQAIDVFLMPFRPDSSTLTTGLVADALGLDRPVVASDFPYISEVLGDAVITYGSSRSDLTACLDRLNEKTIAAATERMRARRRQLPGWPGAASATYDLLREVIESTPN